MAYPKFSQGAPRQQDLRLTSSSHQNGKQSADGLPDRLLFRDRLPTCTQHLTVSLLRFGASLFAPFAARCISYASRLPRRSLPVSRASRSRFWNQVRASCLSRHRLFSPVRCCGLQSWLFVQAHYSTTQICQSSHQNGHRDSLLDILLCQLRTAQSSISIMLTATALALSVSVF